MRLNMPEDYSRSLVKNYKYWSVYIHENQSYLGRCVIWCKRKKALDLTGATKAEQQELFIILKKLKNAATASFKPDLINYAFLSNGTKHLHAHFVPRYAETKKFKGITFTDKRYGHSYRTDHGFITPEKLRQAVKNKLKDFLN